MHKAKFYLGKFFAALLPVSEVPECSTVPIVPLRSWNDTLCPSGTLTAHFCAF